MTARILRSAFIASLAIAIAAACIPGPSGELTDSYVGNDAPVVEVVAVANTAGLFQHDVEFTFTAYDPDDSDATLWDKCPYPDAAGAQPILRISYSVNGGTVFQSIDPAHITLDGAPLEVPTCGQVDSYDSDFRIATSTSGETYTLIWDTDATKPGGDPLNPDDAYVPSSSPVVLRVAVNDGVFTSDPGDTDEIRITNAPIFEFEIPGMRPNEVLTGVEVFGTLTSWSTSGTTVVGPSMDDLTLSDLVITNDTAGTVTVTHGANTAQRPRVGQIITPGAGKGGTDEISEGLMWTCPAVGAPAQVIEYETQPLGGVAQWVCDQLDFDIQGDHDDDERDEFIFVAASSGNLSITLDWDADAATDYDLVAYDPVLGMLIGGPGPFGCGDCCSEAKPEVCTDMPVVAGEVYVIRVDKYAGESVDYDATVTNGP